MFEATDLDVAQVRQLSREMVRELGMLSAHSLAGGVTHSQCYGLLELAHRGPMGVGALAERLRLDRSTASRLVQQLVSRKLIRVTRGRVDRRARMVELTASGRKLVAKIDALADGRVAGALAELTAPERAQILAGMGVYVRALQRARWAESTSIRPIDAADDVQVAQLIRSVMTEHGAVGPGFAIVDPEVSNMSQHYNAEADPPACYFVVDQSGVVVGAAGFAPLRGGAAGTCELRKMYLLPEVRGRGVGRRLLRHILAAAEAAGYRRCYLETMTTMQRAQALYESAGFERRPGPEGATGHHGCNAWYVRDLGSE